MKNEQKLYYVQTLDKLILELFYMKCSPKSENRPWPSERAHAIKDYIVAKYTNVVAKMESLLMALP